MANTEKPAASESPATPDRDVPKRGHRTEETAPPAERAATLDQDEWRLGGEKAGLEPDFEGVGTDPNYRGGSWVDQRGTTRTEPYARSGADSLPDESIEREACERLTRFGRLDPHEVTVSVSRGEVTLTGWVTTEDQKQVVGDLVDGVPGVNDVHNLLQVRPGRR